jgi:zinc transporter 1/2/3
VLFGVKIASCFLLFILAMVCGRWPGEMAQGDKSRYAISLANCFAAGVFMGAGLIHTLSDADSILDKYTDYPAAFVLACLGFFLVFGFDRILGHGNETISPFILAIVLGVHSLIAGMAVGLEHSLYGGLILIGAIIAHKGSAAFALGASLAKSGMSPGTLRKTLLVFATTTPIGILTGTLLSKNLNGRGAQLFEGSFDALAAGTFLYVAIMEILAEEFADHENIRSKYLMTLVGLTVMIALAFFS